MRRFSRNKRYKHILGSKFLVGAKKEQYTICQGTANDIPTNLNKAKSQYQERSLQESLCRSGLLMWLVLPQKLWTLSSDHSYSKNLTSKWNGNGTIDRNRLQTNRGCNGTNDLWCCRRIGWFEQVALTTIKYRYRHFRACLNFQVLGCFDVSRPKIFWMNSPQSHNTYTNVKRSCLYCSHSCHPLLYAARVKLNVAFVLYFCNVAEM